jgi:KDO2-lipid IV(A) lauroyltransferase
MLARLLYYLFLWPLSRLPFPILYFISDILFVLMYYVAPYRKRVIVKNLTRSFPGASPIFIKETIKKFYAHFCDLIVESFKMFSVSEKELRKRVVFTNPEVLQKFYNEKRSVILAGGHYNNWEVYGVACPLYIPHKAIGVYKPLKSEWFDRIMKQSRGQYGLELVSMKATREIFDSGDSTLRALLLAMDQSPSNVYKSYWMTFLNQETGVFFGAEKFSKKYNLPVLFGRINKVKRGHYTFDVVEITSNPEQEPHGYITEQVMHLLETDIKTKPEFWLWSHKRWKRKKPADLLSSAPN